MRQEKDQFSLRLQGSLKEADRCLQCCDAPCTRGCPAGVDVKRFIGLVQKGEFSAAAAVIEKDNPLGLLCGYVCPTAQTCQRNCVSAKLGRPIDIRAIQAYTMELDREFTGKSHRRLAESGSEIRLRNSGMVSVKHCDAVGYGRAAVVGGGPAGLSAAWYLREFGYEVSIFEAADRLGGRLVQGIPPFRVEPRKVEEELKRLCQGIDVQTGKQLGRDFTVDGLIGKGYRGVILAIGKYTGKALHLNGAEKRGVYGADEILSANTWKAGQYKSAVVIGGGNVAVDVARTLVRQGLEQVHICYRGGNLQVKAIQEEREEAYRENITLQLYAVPAAIEGDAAVTGVRFHRGQPDDTANTDIDTRHDFTIPADMVVFAVGYTLRQDDLAGSGIAVRDGVVTVEQFATSKCGVYAAGDAIGGRTVAEAVGSGKAAALALHEHLKKEARQ